MTYREFADALKDATNYVVELTQECANTTKQRDEAREGIKELRDTIKKLVAVHNAELAMHLETAKELEDATQRYHDGICHEQRVAKIMATEYGNDIDELRKALSDRTQECDELATYKIRAQTWLNGHLERHPECMTDFVSTVLLVK